MCVCVQVCVCGTSVGDWAWRTHYFNSLIKRGGHKKCVEITLTCEESLAMVLELELDPKPEPEHCVAIPQLPFTFYGNFTFTKGNDCGWAARQAVGGGCVSCVCDHFAGHLSLGRPQSTLGQQRTTHYALCRPLPPLATSPAPCTAADFVKQSSNRRIYSRALNDT